MGLAASSSSFLTWSAHSSPEQSPVVSISGPGTPPSSTLGQEILPRAPFQNLRTNEIPVHSNISSRLSHRAHPVYSHRSNSLPEITSAGSSSSSPTMEEYSNNMYPSSFPQRQLNGSSSAPPTSTTYSPASNYDSSRFVAVNVTDSMYFSHHNSDINAQTNQSDHYRRNNMASTYVDKRSQYSSNTPHPIREDLRHYAQDFGRHNSGSYQATLNSRSSPLSQTSTPPFQASARDLSFTAQPPVDNPQSNFHSFRSQSAHEFSGNNYYTQSSELNTAPATYQSTGLVAMSTAISSPLFAQQQISQQVPTLSAQNTGSNPYSNSVDYNMNYYDWSR